MMIASAFVNARSSLFKIVFFMQLSCIKLQLIAPSVILRYTVPITPCVVVYCNVRNGVCNMLFENMTIFTTEPEQ